MSRDDKFPETSTVEQTESIIRNSLPAEKKDGLFRKGMSRRFFLGQISLAAATFAAGCTPVRILIKSYPKKFDKEDQLVDIILRAFVLTVIPGAPVDDENLTRIYSDTFYPFHKYCGFFVSDLSDRSKNLFGNDKFDQLSLKQRTAVIEDGLGADGTTARLYRGAILMAQISFYGGIYDDAKGCPLIDFQGANAGFEEEEMYYPNSSAWLAQEITRNGNYL